MGNEAKVQPQQRAASVRAKKGATEAPTNATAAAPAQAPAAKRRISASPPALPAGYPADSRKLETAAVAPKAARKSDGDLAAQRIKHMNELAVGESFTEGYHGKGAFVVSMGGDKTWSATRLPDENGRRRYRVMGVGDHNLISASIGAAVSGDHDQSGGAAAGVGIGMKQRVEFEFKDGSNGNALENAKRAMEIMRTNSVDSLYDGDPKLKGGTDDAAFMRKHATAIEYAAGPELKAGVGLVVGANAGVNLPTGFRIEMDPATGLPKNFFTKFSNTISGKASVSALGFEGLANAQVKVTTEQLYRQPLEPGQTVNELLREHYSIQSLAAPSKGTFERGTITGSRDWKLADHGRSVSIKKVITDRDQMGNTDDVSRDIMRGLTTASENLPAEMKRLQKDGYTVTDLDELGPNVGWGGTIDTPVGTFGASGGYRFGPTKLHKD